MENPYKITIDRQVIKLLGEHLYGDTPSVINELIANSYDARAKNVWIQIKTTPPCQIIVEDDGIGMSVDEMNKYFLNIGYNRRYEKELQDEVNKVENRADMGQKGIGKLAVFALSKTINIFSKKKDTSVIGCYLDFDIITTNDGQPTPINFTDNKISSEQGTRIELLNVTKDLSKSYRYLVAHIARSFFLNDNSIKIYIKKNTDEYAELKRSSLKLFSEMDTLITIGADEKLTEAIEQVKSNLIEDKYKDISKYEDFAEKERFPVLPIKLQVYDSSRKVQNDLNFTFYGWVGTVRDTGSFKSILLKSGYLDEELKDKDITVIDDNRISVYSRGKVGEYNILSKIKSTNANDAYILGEIYVDDFEKNGFIDMATSNRRGYQEDDPRYETLEKILKAVVSRIVNNKQKLSKKRKEDKDEEEKKNIEDSFEKGQNKSKHIFTNLTPEDKENVQEDFFQFSRAVNLSGDKKRILISHKSYYDENSNPHNDYGEFILKVIGKIDSKLASETLFTSSPSHGIRNGVDIYDYLKSCFRDDLFVIFIFSKAFYDSNMCISEAGAAWATNKKYSIMCVDLSFNDVDEPINKRQVGIKVKWPLMDNDITSLANELVYILFETTGKQYTSAEVLGKIHEVIDEYSQVGKSLFHPSFIPGRKFQAIPKCPKCGQNLSLKFDDSTKQLMYECQCGELVQATIK